jgi:hypothetical protein
LVIENYCNFNTEKQFMAKATKQKPIEKEVDKVDIPETISVQAAEPTPPEIKAEEVVIPSQPKIIIFSGSQQTVVEPPKLEGETFEERLLNYAGKGTKVINDFLRIEFKNGQKQQVVNKTLKGKLQGLVDAKKIEVTGNAHHILGKFYYDETPGTKYHTMQNTKIEITVL